MGHLAGGINVTKPLESHRNMEAKSITVGISVVPRDGRRWAYKLSSSQRRLSLQAVSLYHYRLFSRSWSYYYSPSIVRSWLFSVRVVLKNENDVSGLGAYSREYRNRRSGPLHPEVFELWPIRDTVDETQTGEIKSCFSSAPSMSFVVSTEALLWMMVLLIVYMNILSQNLWPAHFWRLTSQILLGGIT